MKRILITVFTISYFVTFIYAQWSTQYTSNPTQSIYCMKFFDNNIGFHSGVLYNSSTMNIYKTTNGGLNYISQNSNYTAQRFMSIFIIHPDTVLISGNYGKILKTVNGGNNWIPYVYSDTVIQFWSLYFVNSFTGFVSGTGGTILKTTNRGENWSNLASTTSTALDGIYFINENTGYVGGANVFLKTTNSGNTWTNKYGSFISPFETAEAVYFSDVNNGIYCTNAGRIVTTTDGGESWNLVYSMTGGIWSLSFPNQNTGYACTSVGTILKTTNGGINWGTQNTPLPSTENIYEISFPSENTGYAASWSGKILKTTNGGLTFISKTGTVNVSEYSLGQNYPNPFNPSTKIKFSIKENAFTSLNVYDVTGKNILTLVNQIMEPGYYDLTLNANELSAGIYFYALESNGYKQTKKMVIIK